MEQRPKPFILGVVLVIALLSTQLNLGSANGPAGSAAQLCPRQQGWSLQAGLLGLLTATSKAHTRDLICCFKDLFKLFPSPYVKGGVGKANDYYYFLDLLFAFRADCSGFVCRILLCVFPQKIGKVFCNAFVYIY